jgi:hypothetical protein
MPVVCDSTGTIRSGVGRGLQGTVECWCCLITARGSRPARRKQSTLRTSMHASDSRSFMGGLRPFRKVSAVRQIVSVERMPSRTRLSPRKAMRGPPARNRFRPHRPCGHWSTA